MTTKEQFEDLKKTFIEETQKHIADINALSFEQFNSDLSIFFRSNNRDKALQTESNLFRTMLDKRLLQLNSKIGKK